MIRDPAGNLYGATNGIDGDEVFKVDQSGNETVLYTFSEPVGFQGVVRDQAGSLFGATCYGGSGHQGMLFKLDMSGQFTALYNFMGDGDGSCPTGQLTVDSIGNLYGATSGGRSQQSINGLIFKLDPAGNETVLHQFTGGADGGFPNGGLIRDAAGNLYGTTSSGSKYHGGVLFVLTK